MICFHPVVRRPKLSAVRAVCDVPISGIWPRGCLSFFLLRKSLRKILPRVTVERWSGVCVSVSCGVMLGVFFFASSVEGDKNKNL